MDEDWIFQQLIDNAFGSYVVNDVIVLDEETSVEDSETCLTLQMI